MSLSDQSPNWLISEYEEALADMKDRLIFMEDREADAALEAKEEYPE